MEKTTKKRKKSKRLKRRIGLIAVGGLSFVLTICLSVGATLAWFAGSTWASNDLYMGGPVYVEMAGRGHNGYETDASAGKDPNQATWQGGSGSLDIVASARNTGTASGQNQGNILLPGQKLLVYSQARVYSTLQTSTLTAGATADQSSGANTSNSSRKDGNYTYYDGSGKIQTTTTSVLRAKFSINIEFDPSVGFNNFTDKTYAEGYPVQSTKYLGEYGTAGYGTANTGDKLSLDEASREEGSDGKLNTDDDEVVQKDSLTWASSLGVTPYKIVRKTTTSGDAGNQTATTVVESEVGRRDAVDNTAYKTTAAYKTGDTTIAKDTSVTPWVNDITNSTELWQIKWGLSKSIYKWKYVSKDAYEDAGDDLAGANAYGIKMGAPFDGKYNTAGGTSANNGGTGNGFYGVWEVVNTAVSGDPVYAQAESEGYYKARTSAYLQSYVENYVDEYNRNLMMEVGSSLEELEDALNNSFIDLVNQSSDNIIAGNVDGFTAGDDGRIAHNTAISAGIPASWLYVDPVIGNDTNSADSASSVGGWWYLVATDGSTMSSKSQVVTTVIDNVTAASANSGAGGATGATTVGTDGVVTYNFSGNKDPLTNAITTVPVDAVNTPYTPAADASGDEKLAAPFKRSEHDATNGVKNTDKRILNAKLYEITPNLTDKLIATAEDGTKTTKVVSVAFPFVNGNFELPGQAMTNIFANAKISFQITFQALQAFFPFTPSIDSIPSGTAITGTGKALNIANSIPVFNEAFDYLSWL